MKTTSVYLLDGGSMELDQSYMFLNAGLTGTRRFPVYSVLIDHAEGTFLFDSGFELAHVANVAAFTVPRQTSLQQIPAQLHLLGLKPMDISHVVNSHYHLDHCGGNKHCRQATTICHKCELETLSGDQEIARGVFLLETIGHTAGHYSLLVKLAGRRPLLFTADACYARKNLDMMCIQDGNFDPARTLSSLQRLKYLAREYDAELMFSHDPDSWPSYRLAPHGYC